MPTPRPVHAKLILLFPLPLATAACDSSPAAPAEGAVAIEVRTSGSSLDADGYVVHVGSRKSLAVGISAPDTASVASGHYLVELTDIADNCSVLGTNPKIMEVAEGTMASLEFDVECGYVPRDLVFMSDRDGHEDIYALGTDGAYPVRLTTDPAEDSWPAWSPDGQRIAFVREGAVFVMDAGGGSPHSLHGAGGDAWIEDVEWSPEGTRLAYTLGVWDDWWWGDEFLWVIDADGSHPTQLAEGYDPAWGPDGSRIAFSSLGWVEGGEGLRVINADGSNLVDLTDYSAAEAAWSPDGTRIAFRTVGSGGDENAEIRAIGVDGSGLVRLTGYGGQDRHPVWSPDGTRVAFVSRREDNQDIYIVEPDGSGLRRLTTHPAPDYEPVWSPDGGSIVFTTERDGNAEIYLIDADGSDPVNLTNHPGRDRAPSWAAQVAAAPGSGRRD